MSLWNFDAIDILKICYFDILKMCHFWHLENMSFWHNHHVTLTPLLLKTWHFGIMSLWPSFVWNSVSLESYHFSLLSFGILSLLSLWQHPPPYFRILSLWYYFNLNTHFETISLWRHVSLTLRKYVTLTPSPYISLWPNFYWKSVTLN